VLTNLLAQKPNEVIARMYIEEEKNMDSLLTHCYCKSITTITIPLLNIRKDTKAIITNKKPIRLIYLNKVLDNVLETTGDSGQLELHLGMMNILGDAIQNSENIYEGKQIVKELFFNQENFSRIISTLSDTSKTSLGHLPNLLNVLVEYAKKNEPELHEGIQH